MKIVLRVFTAIEGLAFLTLVGGLVYHVARSPLGLMPGGYRLESYFIYAAVGGGGGVLGILALFSAVLPRTRIGRILGGL